MNKHIKNMKTSSLFLAFTVVIFSGSALMSCSEEKLLNDDATEVIATTSIVTDDADIDGNFEEIDDLSLSILDTEPNSGGRMEGNRDERFSCAEVSVEVNGDTHIITVDFGEGCEGPNGHIRKGIMLITAEGKPWEIGSTHITELIDFYVDDVKLEGTHTVTNITESLDSSPAFSIQLTDGKAIWNDDSFATRNMNRIRTILRATNPSGDEVYVEGTVNGMTREGNAYNGEIVEPLVFKRSCRVIGFTPVSGINELTIDDSVTSIDFGNGECDNVAVVTRNGETFEITLNYRRKM